MTNSEHVAVLADERKVAAERNDFIHLDVLPSTYRALEELASRQGWRDLSKYVEPGEMLLLIERLKKATDTEQIFPHGKWATIQRLQDLFNKGFWV